MSEGICPKCNSDNLDYLETNFDDSDSISYWFKCNDCEIEGWETFNLTFGGQYDNNGKRLDE